MEQCNPKTCKLVIKMIVNNETSYYCETHKKGYYPDRVTPEEGKGE